MDTVNLKVVPRDKPSCGTMPAICVFTAKTELGSIRRVAIPVEWITFISECEDYTTEIMIGQETFINALEPLEVCLALYQEARASSMYEEEEASK